jgi:hypothetical protein
VRDGQTGAKLSDAQFVEPETQMNSMSLQAFEEEQIEVIPKI